MFDVFCRFGLFQDCFVFHKFSLLFEISLNVVQFVFLCFFFDSGVKIFLRLLFSKIGSLGLSCFGSFQVGFSSFSVALTCLFRCQFSRLFEIVFVLFRVASCKRVFCLRSFSVVEGCFVSSGRFKMCMTGLDFPRKIVEGFSMWSPVLCIGSESPTWLTVFRMNSCSV